MAKNTQLFNLFNMMKAAGSKGVTKQQVSKQLGISEGSVPVYVFGLKKYFKADYEAIKQGRQVLAYKLVNSDGIVVPQFRKGSKALTKPLAKNTKVVKLKSSKAAPVSSTGEVPTPDKDLSVAEITDREFNDIKSSLGLI